MILRVLGVSLIGLTLAGCVNDSSLSGDVYSASEAKQVQNVTYGTVVNARPVQIQGGDENNVMGAIGAAVVGGLLVKTVGQGVQGAMNKTQGVELEIRKDDGSTIMVVQKQGSTRFSAGQRVVLASNGSQVTVSPR